MINVHQMYARARSTYTVGIPCSALAPHTTFLPTIFPFTTMDHGTFSITTVLAIHELTLVTYSFTRSSTTVNSMVTSPARTLSRKLVGFPLIDCRGGAFRYQPKKWKPRRSSSHWKRH